MGALVAVLQSDPNLLRCQIHRLRDHVTLAEENRLPDAYGYGYYSGSAVLVGKRPSGAPSLLSLEELIDPIDSEALVAHARHATTGNHKDENTHPFRFRRWLFAHDGTIADFQAVKPKLLAALPDYLRRNIQGETDSEHAFTYFLTMLRDSGQLDELDVDPAVVGRCLAQTARQIDAWCREVGAQRPSGLNFIVTDGRVLAATRRARPLHYALLEGIMPCTLEGIDASTPESDPRMRPHRKVKAVCFATHLLAPNSFIEVPEGSVVTVSRSLQVSVAALASV
jgi:glutamine amidotransferase